MDFTSMARPMLLSFLLVALGVAVVCALVSWRAGRDQQRQLLALRLEIEALRGENQRLAGAKSFDSHELVQPYGTITNLAEMIRRHSTGDARTHASTIIEVSARAARKIREVNTTAGSERQDSEPRADRNSERAKVVEPRLVHRPASVDPLASSTGLTAGSEPR